MLRCVSSGTEATMSALRVARGFTGRDVIVKFDGGYHGHSDSLLVKAGSGARHLRRARLRGRPGEHRRRHTATLAYNDVPALEALFARRGREIAAVIVEPVAGNMGCVPPEPGFLEAIVELCRRHGAAQHLRRGDDRLPRSRAAAPRSASACAPDLTCLGKVDRRRHAARRCTAGAAT